MLDWVQRDHEVFFNTDDLATEASFRFVKTPPGDVDATLNGIFEDQTDTAEIGQYTVGASAPRFTCPFSPLLDRAREGDWLAVNGAVYRLADAPKVSDLTGICVLELVPEESQDDQGDSYQSGY